MALKLKLFNAKAAVSIIYIFFNFIKTLFFDLEVSYEKKPAFQFDVFTDVFVFSQNCS